MKILSRVTSTSAFYKAAGAMFVASALDVMSIFAQHSDIPMISHPMTANILNYSSWGAWAVAGAYMAVSGVKLYHERQNILRQKENPKPLRLS